MSSDIATPSDLRLSSSWTERFQLSMAFATPILALMVVFGLRYVDTEGQKTSAEELRAARLAACEVANEYNEAVILTALTYSFTNGGAESVSVEDQIVLNQVTELNAQRDAACRSSANAVH